MKPSRLIYKVYKPLNIPKIREITSLCEDGFRTTNISEALMCLWRAFIIYNDITFIDYSQKVTLPTEIENVIVNINYLRFNDLEDRRKYYSIVSSFVSSSEIKRYAGCIKSCLKFSDNYNFNSILRLYLAKKQKCLQSDMNIFEIINEFKISYIPGHFIGLLCDMFGVFSPYFCEEFVYYIFKSICGR